MALKLRKDIKKSLYYVWFLGAKESKGLKGSEYIIPVIKHLEQREKEIEPFKVTLQVSHKGLKIIQNIVAQGKTKPKNEIIKHFIPHNTITYVYQQEDIIACILLLFNPVTKCPLHIHAYRCDSAETAGLLKQQLQVLIESPENQKKFAEIEGRLNPSVKEVNKLESALGSDTGTSTRESESSEERIQSENARVTTLYDSVAAELRAKLKKNNEPILLPPRDYDTVHRQKGNLTGIELRRCLTVNIVGQQIKAKRLESSGASSGIGSDHPPSPDSPSVPDSRFNTLDNHSTSDEEWNANNDSSLYLMNSASSYVTLPRMRSNSELEGPEDCHNECREANSNRYQEPTSCKPSRNEQRCRQEKYSRDERPVERDFGEYLEKPGTKFTDNNYQERRKSSERERQKTGRSEKISELEIFINGHKSFETPNSKNKKYNYEITTIRYYNELDENRESEQNNNKRYYDEEIRTEGKDSSRKHFEDDGFDEEMRYKNSTNSEKPKYNNKEDCRLKSSKSFQNPSIPKTRQRYVEDYSSERKYESPNYIEDCQRYSEIHCRNKVAEGEFRREPESRARIKKPLVKYDNEHEFQARNINCHEIHVKEDNLRPRTKHIIANYEEIVRMRPKKPTHDKYQKDHRYYDEDSGQRPRSVGDLERQRFIDDNERTYNRHEIFEKTSNIRKKPELRQRSPSPEVTKVSPQDRFRDAKEKFLSMEREKPANHRIDVEEHVGNKASYLKRNESMINTAKERYHETFFGECKEAMTRSSPRYAEELRYRRESPSVHYRNMDKMDAKHRSIPNSIEDEHRKNSNEIAKEINRRSYLESSNFEEYEAQDSGNTCRNILDTEKCTKIDREFNSNKSSQELDGVAETQYDPKYVRNLKPKSYAGYRHSYAEPKIRTEIKTRYLDMLHRTGSSVGTNGRASYLKRNESMINTAKERYHETFFGECKEAMTRSSPRYAEELRYRRESPSVHYRNMDKMDAKHRSISNSIEDEHRKNSNEIAKEINRRSYLESSNFEEYEAQDSENTCRNILDTEKCTKIDREFNSNKSSQELDGVAETQYDPKYVRNLKPKSYAGYRHSYAEPKIRTEIKMRYLDMLHRTGSSVGTNGRVGIASVQPY